MARHSKCDHDWVIFFLMTGERKMEPMNSIFGRLTNYVATKIGFCGQVPHIDNSDPTVAYLMEPTQKCSKM